MVVTIEATDLCKEECIDAAYFSIQFSKIYSRLQTIMATNHRPNAEPKFELAIFSNFQLSTLGVDTYVLFLFCFLFFVFCFLYRKLPPSKIPISAEFFSFFVFARFCMVTTRVSHRIILHVCLLNLSLSR